MQELPEDFSRMNFLTRIDILKRIIEKGEDVEEAQWLLDAIIRAARD